MLMKIFILFYILMCIKGMKRLFVDKNYISTMRSDILKSFERDTPEKSLVSYFWSGVIVSTIYTIAYIHIGKTNTIMSWLSAIQIMLTICSSYSVVKLAYDIKEGVKGKYPNVVLKYIESVFDVVYIGLAIHFMYLV